MEIDNTKEADKQTLDKKEQKVTISLKEGTKETEGTKTLEVDAEFMLVTKSTLKEIGVTNLTFLLKDKTDGISFEDLKKENLFKNFDESKISYENNTLKVEDGLLSTENWESIKSASGANELMAYRVTILEDGKKVAKIAMYEDGTAVIEK